MNGSFALSIEDFYSRKMKSDFVHLNELASLISEKENSWLHRAQYYREQDPELWASLEFDEQFESIENDLRQLDPESWNFLKNKAKPLCVKRDERRGWREIVDTLNEAKGYCFLKSIGCSRIRFIPPENTQGNETPDLEGWRDSLQVLCEVKTIHESDDLITARENITAFKPQSTLTFGLKRKLKSTFKKAADQLTSYAESSKCEKYIYLIITYDDGIFFGKQLNQQTRELFNTRNLVGINLIIHNE